MNRSDHSLEKPLNRSRSGRRSSQKRRGFYTKEVSQMYSKFLLRKSNLPSNEPFSPMSHVSRGSKGRTKIAFENRDLKTCETKSYSTLNVTSHNASQKKQQEKDTEHLANTVVKVVQYQQVLPFHN